MQEEKSCLRHIGTHTTRGYPVVGKANERRSLRKVIYQQCYGSIPDGYSVTSTCDNTWCIQPSHLTLVSHANRRKTNRTKVKNTPTKAVVARVLTYTFHGTNKEIAEFMKCSIRTVQVLRNEN